MSTELIITLAALAVELAALAFLFIQSRKPPIPGKVRVFPYTFVIVAVIILVYLTAAHAISLITGVQVQPRRRKGT